MRVHDSLDCINSKLKWDSLIYVEFIFLYCHVEPTCYGLITIFSCMIDRWIFILIIFLSDGVICFRLKLIVCCVSLLFQFCIRNATKRNVKCGYVCSNNWNRNWNDEVKLKMHWKRPVLQPKHYDLSLVSLPLKGTPLDIMMSIPVVKTLS